MTSLNVLAADKSVMKFLIPKKGWKLVGADISSLEPHVIAHFSQCPNYMALYGPDAVPNQDAYLRFGCNVPAYRDIFREYYDIEAPSKEGVSYLKEHHELERFVCKVGFLSLVYGIQPPALQANYESKGVIMSLKEVEAIYRAYWETHKQVKQFTIQLQQEWRRNGGYVISGRGTPRPIERKDAAKDMLSRFVQGTGSLITKRWIHHVRCIRDEKGVNMVPYIADLHDASYWQAPEEEVAEAAQVLESAFARLNDELQWTVQIRGEVKIGDNMAEVK